MMSTWALQQFLAKTTGLPLKQAIELYDAGYPWPMWTTYDTRKAGVLAQAKGLLFPKALAITQAETDAEVNVLLVTIEANHLSRGLDSLTDRYQVLLSLPWMKEMKDHVEEVAARTGASPQAVFQFSKAVQHYALHHPEWELANSCVGKRPN